MAMIAEMRIETLSREGITRLKHSFCTQPFKITDITEDRTKKTLRLMLMSASPGVLDGDAYNFKIKIREGCALNLQTQSYQRLFTMKNSASQHMEVELEKNASFYFLPHPVVPHAAADFTATNKIFLSGGCTLLWGEVLTCGRKLNGEIFLFSRYHSITEIFSHGRLMIKENLFLQPSAIDLNGIGQMEGHTHQATMIYLNESINVKTTIKTISDGLTGEQGILFGITAAPMNGIIIRLLGNKAEQLHDCLKRIMNWVSGQWSVVSGQ